MDSYDCCSTEQKYVNLLQKIILRITVGYQFFYFCSSSPASVCCCYEQADALLISRWVGFPQRCYHSCQVFVRVLNFDTLQGLLMCKRLSRDFGVRVESPAIQHVTMTHQQMRRAMYLYICRLDYISGYISGGQPMFEYFKADQSNSRHIYDFMILHSIKWGYQKLYSIPFFVSMVYMMLEVQINLKLMWTRLENSRVYLLLGKILNRVTGLKTFTSF